MGRTASQDCRTGPSFPVRRIDRLARLQNEVVAYIFAPRGVIEERLPSKTRSIPVILDKKSGQLGDALPPTAKHALPRSTTQPIEGAPLRKQPMRCMRNVPARCL